MHSVFSIEDLVDSFWAASAQALSPASLAAVAPPGMSRSQSELAFEKFFEEINASGSEMVPSSVEPQPSASENGRAVLRNDMREINKLDGGQARDHRQHDLDRGNHNQPVPAYPSFTVGPDHHQALLKSKLDRACAAAAAFRATSMKPEDLAAASEMRKQPEQLPPQAQGPSTIESEPVASSISTSLAATRKKGGLQAKQASSGSSREDSDDDELEVDIEITDNMDPAEIKRARRMLSNRESARRSRRRKQEQMTELETQVGQLRVEHSSFLKRLSDVNHKCDEAAVENRILKADIETLRAKVKMAEETVKRVTGMSPLLLGRTSGSLPYASSQMTAPSIPIQPKTNQHLKPPTPDTRRSSLDQRNDTSFQSSAVVRPSVNTLNNPGGQNLAETTQFQHSALGCHMQKQVGLTGSGSHVDSRALPVGAVPVWNLGISRPTSESNPQK